MSSKQSKDYKRLWYLENRDRLLEPARKRAALKRDADNGAENRAYKVRNKERHRESSRKCHLKLRYGITIEEYNRMLSVQKGRCSICGEVWWSLLVVDHDHVTGEVRGLLCDTCNTGIAWLKESVDVLKAAVKYLSKK